MFTGSAVHPFWWAVVAGWVTLGSWLLWKRNKVEREISNRQEQNHPIRAIQAMRVCVEMRCGLLHSYSTNIALCESVFLVYKRLKLLTIGS